MSGIPQNYTSQIRLENGITYYTGEVYPDKAFFDYHWRHGNGPTIVIPSNLVWDQITEIAPYPLQHASVLSPLVEKSSVFLRHLSLHPADRAAQ